MPHGDQHISRPGLDLSHREIRRRQQLERIHVVDADVRLRVPGAERQRQHEGAQERARGNGRHVTDCEERQKRGGSTRDDEHQARRNPQPAKPHVERYPVPPRPRHARPEAHERRKPDDERCPDADRVGVRNPRHASAAREDDQDGGRRGDVGGVRVSTEPWVLPDETLGEPVRRGEPPEQLLSVRERCMRRGEEQHDGGDSEQHTGDRACPRGACEMLAETGEGRVEPELLHPGRHQQRVEEGEGHGHGEREERDDRAGTPQGADARRLVFVRALRQRVAAPEKREADREGNERRHREVRDPRAGSREPRHPDRGEHVHRNVVAHHRDRAPDDDPGEDADSHPHASRDPA